MNKTFFTPEIVVRAKQRPRGYVEALRRCASFVSEHAMVFDTTSPCWKALHDRYGRATPRSITRKVPIVASGCSNCVEGRKAF